MPKKIKLLLSLIGVFAIGISSYIIVDNSKKLENNKIVLKEANSMMSMMIEQTEGTGDYKTATTSKWPGEGYTFNAELSSCEKNGKLTWDKTTNSVVYSGNLTDKCYLFFDIYVAPSMADYCSSGTALTTCVKNFGDQGSSISNIYIHNSSLTNGAGDNSYRFAGPSDEVNNFVCFGTDATPCPTDNLYRIIGLIGTTVKLIKYDYASSNLLGTNGNYYNEEAPATQYYKGHKTVLNNYYRAAAGANNAWSSSALNTTNLNTNYLNNIGSTWANKIVSTTWKTANITWDTFALTTIKAAYNNEIGSPTSTSTATGKVGLLYGSEYGYAASPVAWTDSLLNYPTYTAMNWMYMGGNDGCIGSHRCGSNNQYYCVVDIWAAGSIAGDEASMDVNIRPTFNLATSVTFVSGRGTFKDPIRIN